MRNGLIAGCCDSGLRFRFCTAFRFVSVRVVATASSFVLDSVVSSGTSCCSTSRFSVCGLCFRLALLSDCGHRLRVPMMCDDSTVVAYVSLQDGTMSHFPLLVDVSPFGVVRLSRPPPPLDSLPGRFLCSGRFSSTVGIRLWGPSGFSIPVGATLLCAWAFPSVDCSRRGLPELLPLFCSLVLNRRVIFLTASRIH